MKKQGTFAHLEKKSFSLSRASSERKIMSDMSKEIIDLKEEKKKLRKNSIHTSKKVARGKQYCGCIFDTKKEIIQIDNGTIFRRITGKQKEIFSENIEP